MSGEKVIASVMMMVLPRTLVEIVFRCDRRLLMRRRVLCNRSCPADRRDDGLAPSRRFSPFTDD